MVRLTKSAQNLELATPAWCLVFERGKPWQVTLRAGTGAEVARLFLGSAVDLVTGRDELIAVEAPTLSRRGEVTEVIFAGESTAWDAKRYIFACHDEGVAYRVEVEGTGQLETCRLLSATLRADLEALGMGPARFRGGYERPFGDLCHGSQALFTSYFTARPTAAEREQRPLWESDTIDLVDDPARHGGCDSFLPAPWCWALEMGDEQPWVSLGLAPEPDELAFTAVRFRAAHSFGIELDYNGTVSVEGLWRSPELLFQFGSRDAERAFRQYVAALVTRGRVHCPIVAPAAWWTWPAVDLAGQQAWRGATAAGTSSLPETLDALAILAAGGVRPGVLWLAPGWMGEYGQPDPLRWPDLAGFIARQHDDGRRVILPWPLFGDGVPDDDTAVAERARQALAPDGLGADGLLLRDVLPPHGDVATLRDRIAAVRAAIRAVRRDALLIAPTVNPYFAHLVDMVPLGSLESDRRTALPLLRHRAAMARVVSPGWLLAVSDRGIASREAWDEWVTEAPQLGVPVLAHAEGLPVPREPLDRDDLAWVADTWGMR